MIAKSIFNFFFISILFANSLHSQNSEKASGEQELQYFLKECAQYKATDVPSTTTYGNLKLSFPWMYLNQDQWEGLGEYLEDPYFKAIHERNLMAYEAFVADHKEKGNKEMFHKGTNVRIYKKWIARATVAWYLTKDVKYLEMAKAVLKAACQSDYWQIEPPGLHHINAAGLKTGELTYTVCFGYDALFPYLDESIRLECINALVEKGIHAYLEGHRLNDWWVKCDFNWNSALHGNAGLAAMIIRDAEPELSDYVLKLVKTGLPYMIESFYPGGGYIEGVMYQGTAIGHLTDFAVPYYQLTGDDLGLLTNDAFHKTIGFWMPMFAPDGYAYNFSDLREKGSIYGIAHGFWWADKLQQPEWAWDQERRTSQIPGAGGLFYDVEAFWYRQPYQESLEPDLQGFKHFKGIDWAIWRGDESWLAFRSGFNGGNHDNDDLGNFILGYGQDRFLIDPGYGAIKASQHNCATIRSKEQTDGATSYIRETAIHEDGFYLKCDIAETYPHTAKHYNRHLLLIDDKHLLLIDDVFGAKSRRATVYGHLQTRYPVERIEKGWQIDGPNHNCKVELLFDFGLLTEEPWEFNGPITKLVYKNFSDRIHSVQPVLFSFDDTPYSYALNEDGFSLQIGGKSYDFIYSGNTLTYSVR